LPTYKETTHDTTKDLSDELLSVIITFFTAKHHGQFAQKKKKRRAETKETESRDKRNVRPRKKKKASRKPPAYWILKSSIVLIFIMTP